MCNEDVRQRADPYFLKDSKTSQPRERARKLRPARRSGAWKGAEKLKENLKTNKAEHLNCYALLSQRKILIGSFFGAQPIICQKHAGLIDLLFIWLIGNASRTPCYAGRKKLFLV